MTNVLKRKPLDFSNFPSIINDMAAGSSDAAAVIDELIDLKGETNSLASLFLLDDMNIRGIQIYELYKICHQNIDEFFDKITNIKAQDITKLNKITASLCIYKATLNGSKEERIEKPSKYLFTDEEREESVHIKSNTFEDMYPTVGAKEALNILKNKGFTCGYTQTYTNKEKEKEVYRIFYNDLKDIIYTHSLEDKDIFLWGASKLNVVRKRNHTVNTSCNAYFNVKGVVGYNIELKEHPFKTYDEISKEEKINNIKNEYYDNNLIPIIETVKGIKYKEEYPAYKSCVMATIYDLLKFKETYKSLDDNLKKIYKNLLNTSEDKAYDTIISHLNSDEGIEIAVDLQNVLGVSLEKEKLLKAKDRFCEYHGHKTYKCENKFLSKLMTDNSWGKEINDRIIKILRHDINPVKVK